MRNPFTRKYHKLSVFAKALDVHPRTILRALTGNPTEYWAPKHNPSLRIADIARLFSMPPKSLRSLIAERDVALSPNAAATLMRISVRTLRNKAREYPPLAVGSGFLRYSKDDVMMWHAERKAEGRDRLHNLF